MARQLTRTSRLLAGALALALAALSPVICFAATFQMQEAQHACCTERVSECGSGTAMRQDCCAAQRLEFAGLAPATPSPLVAPPSATSLALVVPEPLVLLPPSTGFDPDVSKPTATPTYLLVSVFRL